MTQFICAKALKTALQADVAMKKSGFTFPWGSSAAMSSENPARSIISSWKNKACQAVEAEVARLKAAGWTPQDFAKALKGELATPKQPSRMKP